VKRHAGTSFHRATQREVTGIEERAWRDYAAVAEEAGLPLWIVFAHEEGPPGFIGGELRFLRQRISHRHSGMIFWPVGALRRIERREDMGFPAHDMRHFEPPDDFEPEISRTSCGPLDFGDAL
jgi:hypothetical protein